MTRNKAKDVKALLTHQKEFIETKLKDKNCEDQWAQMHADIEKVEKKMSQIEKYL
jgi:hypothetical protein